MWRVACVLLAPLASATLARAADLPPGAVARLGDDRFRAGGAIDHLALSPDGKQYATVRSVDHDFCVLEVWDSATGRPLREHRLNAKLFCGVAWGRAGGFAVVRRAEPGPKGEPARVARDDFRVWEFSDPKADAPPLMPPEGIVERASGSILDAPPKARAEYTQFHLSTDGSRVAAEWEGPDGKFGVHVFELKAADSAAKLTRAGGVDLGAERADAVRISADGETVVTFRELADPDRGPTEFVATRWDAARGKPWWKPFRVSTSNPYPGTRGLLLAPDARSAFVAAREEKVWGFDEVPLVMPFKDPNPKRRRGVARWPFLPDRVNALVTCRGTISPGVARWPFLPDRVNSLSLDFGGHAFNAKGTILVIAANRGTFVLDLATGKELARFEGHAHTPCAVAVSADGSRIATADYSGLVRLWDANTLRAINDTPGHRAAVSHAELSPDGKRLLTWAEDETVRLWDVATGKELRAFAGATAPPRGERGRPTFTPDGTAVLYSTAKRLVARDLQTGLEVPLPGEMAKLGPRLVVFAPDGKAVLTWSNNGDDDSEVWDWPGGRRRCVLSGDFGPPPGPGFSPDGIAVFADARSPQRWDSQTGKELPPAWRDDRTSSVEPLLSLRPNPRRLLHRPDPGEPRVIEAGTGRHLTQFRLAGGDDDAPLARTPDVALAPPGSAFAVALGREPGTVLLCESATGEARRELRGHRGEARVLGFTPDGTKLLTAGGDHTVLVWDVRLQGVPLPEAVKKETSAAKLWNTLTTGSAKDAYLAMARLAREPGAAVRMAAMKLKPAAEGERDTDATRLADARGVELLEALDTDAARDLLKELAGGAAGAFRTREAKRALERNAR